MTYLMTVWQKERKNKYECSKLNVFVYFVESTTIKVTISWNITQNYGDHRFVSTRSIQWPQPNPYQSVQVLVHHEPKCSYSKWFDPGNEFVISNLWTQPRLNLIGYGTYLKNCYI